MTDTATLVERAHEQRMLQFGQCDSETTRELIAEITRLQAANAELSKCAEEARDALERAVERADNEPGMRISILRLAITEAIAALLTHRKGTGQTLEAPDRCPDCGGRTFAQVDIALPEGGFGPGPMFCCVNCKLHTPSPLAKITGDA